MVVTADHCLLESDYKRQGKLGTASITLVKVLCSHRNVTQVIKQDFMALCRSTLRKQMTCSNKVYKI